MNRYRRARDNHVIAAMLLRVNANQYRPREKNMRSKHIRRSGWDALDLAAVWPSTAQLAGFPLPQVEVRTEPAGRARDQIVMEYGEAISSVAAQKALAIACLKVAGGPWTCERSPRNPLKAIAFAWSRERTPRREESGSAPYTDRRFRSPRARAARHPAGGLMAPPPCPFRRDGPTCVGRFRLGEDIGTGQDRLLRSDADRAPHRRADREALGGGIFDFALPRGRCDRQRRRANSTVGGRLALSRSRTGTFRFRSRKDSSLLLTIIFE